MSKEFFGAIEQGNLEEVRRLLSREPNLIYERNENGLSPVMIAAYCRRRDILEFLCENAGALNIFEAAATGKTRLALRHIARAPALTNAYTSDGFQPLGLACFLGHYETAERLIQVGAAVNSPSRNEDGFTPIQLAAAAGNADIVLLLLEHDANPNARESRGLTPLHLAAQNGDVKTLHILLFNGADLSIGCNQGKLPLDMAIEAGHTQAADLLRQGITRRFKTLRLPNAATFTK